MFLHSAWKMIDCSRFFSTQNECWRVFVFLFVFFGSKRQKNDFVLWVKVRKGPLLTYNFRFFGFLFFFTFVLPAVIRDFVKNIYSLWHFIRCGCVVRASIKTSLLFRRFRFTIHGPANDLDTDISERESQAFLSLFLFFLLYVSQIIFTSHKYPFFEFHYGCV